MEIIKTTGARLEIVWLPNAFRIFKSPSLLLFTFITKNQLKTLRNMILLISMYCDTFPAVPVPDAYCIRACAFKVLGVINNLHAFYNKFTVFFFCSHILLPPTAKIILDCNILQISSYTFSKYYIL